MFIKNFFAILALILSVTAICSAEVQKFDTLATTYTEENGSALTLIRLKSNGNILFAVTEASSQSVAFVKFDQKTYNFYLNKDEHGFYPPLMFVMATTRQNDPVDDKLGIWQGDTHLIPVYAIFDVRDGQIIFDAPYFYSGEETITPSHYHSNIQNPIHTRLIKTLMTKMPLLHADIEAKGIALP